MSHTVVIGDTELSSANDNDIDDSDYVPESGDSDFSDILDWSQNITSLVDKLPALAGNTTEDLAVSEWIQWS